MAKGTPADQATCFRCRHSLTPRTNIDTAGLLQRLRSEYGTATVDTKEVAEMLKAIDMDLEDYESEVSLLQSRILYIKTQQTRLKEHAVNLRSLNSPVRKVPNEILLRIFDYACDKNLLQEFPWSKDFQFPPSTPIVEAFRHLPAMSISSVCARWRSVALSASVIWSRISLELSPENSRLPDVESVLSGFLHTVELHLHRSEKRPLTVELNVSGSLDDENNLVPHQLLAFDLVRKRSWCSFGLGGRQSLSHIPKPTIQNCHSLQSLDLMRSEDPDQELELFKLASGLRSLVLVWLGATQSRGFWKEISSLTVYSVEGDISNVFNHAFNPKELVLRERIFDGALPISPCVPPRLCTSVSILRLCLRLNWNDSLANAAFSSFTFPSLSSLIIRTDAAHPYQGAWPKATLGAFLHRSSCNLTNFEVRYVPVNDSDLISALRLMPSLVRLYVDDTPAGGDDQTSPITPRFIRGLHGFLRTELSPSSSALVPKLSELRLTFNGLQFDDSAFIDMVSSRWLPDAQYASGVGLSCLRVVTLRFAARAVDEAVYRPLNYLDKAGMMVVVLGMDDW
ncbi:hypothetical protein BDP27DRAFT_1321037 [Rhodocollybia butyracea]|uniref:F-box domain-containing protein n=1 Tax=Rhodocollybia butyracea TaxID=206335 RepID=A0A9P5UAJ0_9AGAR|nr:hypothetical protein BDP27DRAFT_1321037 [Rhodocollybia butyracea]